METFSWNPRRKAQYAVSIAGVVACVLIWWFLPADPERPLVLWGLLLPALLLIEGATEVDSSRRVIVRRWQWMGFLPLGKREVALDEFVAVTLRGIQDPQPGDPVYLMLVRKDGRFTRVEFFPESAVQDGVALDASERLSRVTGLPFADYPERAYSRPIAARG
jgi:hypothetical protein